MYTHNYKTYIQIVRMLPPPRGALGENTLAKPASDLSSSVPSAVDSVIDERASQARNGFTPHMCFT